jgi:thiol:disulfide interchange protein DsbD
LGWIAKVQDRSNRFIWIRAENALNEELLRRYNVKGVPTVVFIDPDGRERDDLRLVDFLPADQFLDRMELLTKENSGG